MLFFFVQGLYADVFYILCKSREGWRWGILIFLYLSIIINFWKTDYVLLQTFIVCVAVKAAEGLDVIRYSIEYWKRL